MADPLNEYPVALQFLKSPVFVSTATAAVSQIVAILGYQVPQLTISQDVAAAAQIIAILATAYAGYKRWRAGIQPLTLTKAKADEINAAAPPTQSPAPMEKTE